MKKILGLDLGTNSIGWALVETDFEKKQGKILGMGSRIIPMGADKINYERGIGITKNAMRREKRSARKGNKRYKLRRNKLLFILNELGMLPDQFQFKNGLPKPEKLQELELLPIPKETKQLDALGLLELKVKALDNPIELKEFGKILYQFNQLRGYSGGNLDDDNKNKKKEDEDIAEKQRYEVIVQKVEIIKVEQSIDTFTVTSGKDKGEKLHYYNVTVYYNDEEIQGQTKLQNLIGKEGNEEELEIRITRKKDKSVSYIFSLPKKTDWRKAMELSEKALTQDNLFISQLLLRDLRRDLQQDKWGKIRNRVFLRNRYKAEFDKIWDTQEKSHELLKNCPKATLEKIANYIFPGTSESQQHLRKTALEKGLKYIIKEQVIYYQRPLKPQTEFISNCRFEKEEKVIANSHPLFQEFRCWKQINNLFITTKAESLTNKNKYHYQNRYLTIDEKFAIYDKLQNQKEVSYGAVIDILNQDKSKGKLDKEQKDYFLNGLNYKAKLKGCDTLLTIKKELGEYFDEFIKKDEKIVEKIWSVIFDVSNHDGSEYDVKSKRVSSIFHVLRSCASNDEIATELSLKLAQNIRFPRKYANLSAKAILNILPLMIPNNQHISPSISTKYERIRHLIDTGEIIDDTDLNLESYVIDFVKSNPNAIQEGGLMEYLAISLVYGKHTAEKIEAQIKNYHDIKYKERNLRNPIVEQVVNETMQIIKAVWKQYNLNTNELEIRVELARDLKNSSEERDKIWKAQIKARKNNDRIIARLAEHGIIVTEENILKYKLYEQQKGISPYTQNKTIPFSSLFDKRLYDIDHIIPKSRYYDDSISNKVICETRINEEKSNRTAWEYITGQHSKEVRSVEDFVNYVNQNYYGKKKKNLLAEKIPSNPIERQLKETQYITVAIKNELAKIVGSDNVKTSTGEVTDFLRSRWGLRRLFMELTESRFKRMELWDLDENGNPKTKWVKREVINDGEKVKNLYEIKNWSKRYDHRHHSVDALVVALTTQSNIQRLNNLNKYYQDELTRRKDEFNIKVKEGESTLEAFFNLEAKRRDEILRQIESSRHFEKPFEDLVEQARHHLEKMVVSHKPKEKLGIKVDETSNKKQLKIRGALHRDTYYGKLNGRDTKRVEISTLSSSDVSKIVVDEVLANEIIEHKNNFDTMREAFTGEGLELFNDNRKAKGKHPVYKVKVWYNKVEKKESGLQRLYENNDKQSVITGDNYLFLVMEKDGKRIFDIASLYDSVSIANDALKNNIHDIKKIIAEDYRIKHKGKPEKVLFTLQQNELVYLPKGNDDEVLTKTKSEFAEWISQSDNKKMFCKRVYKVVKFTGKDCFFIPHNYANPISLPKDLSNEQKDELKKKYKDKTIPKQEKNYEEFGSYDNCVRTEVNSDFVKELVLKKDFKGNPPMKIQEYCIKIQIDWLGNITLS